MKKYMLLFTVCLLMVSCNAQNNKADNLERDNTPYETPKGSWKVDKEFDENGNLTRYDSIYSWSSHDTYNTLGINKDSLMQSFKSRFYSNFSRFEDEGFQDIFSKDSLFSKRFFNDDFFGSSFGKDFMDIDHIRQQMMDKQKRFLEKYQSEFIKPEDEN